MKQWLKTFLNILFIKVVSSLKEFSLLIVFERIAEQGGFAEGEFYELLALE